MRHCMETWQKWNWNWYCLSRFQITSGYWKHNCNIMNNINIVSSLSSHFICELSLTCIQKYQPKISCWRYYKLRHSFATKHSTYPYYKTGNSVITKRVRLFFSNCSRFVTTRGKFIIKIRHPLKKSENKTRRVTNFLLTSKFLVYNWIDLVLPQSIQWFKCLFIHFSRNSNTHHFNMFCSYFVVNERLNSYSKTATNRKTVTNDKIISSF